MYPMRPINSEARASQRGLPPLKPFNQPMTAPSTEECAVSTPRYRVSTGSKLPDSMSTR